MADATMCQEMRATNHTSRGKAVCFCDFHKTGTREQLSLCPRYYAIPPGNPAQPPWGEADSCFGETQEVHVQGWPHLLPRAVASRLNGYAYVPVLYMFGREGTPPAEAVVAGSTGGAGASTVLPKKKGAVSRRHIKFDDFSRHRIEEHYTKSQPKQWASY
jgi:hypothetical protein